MSLKALSQNTTLETSREEMFMKRWNVHVHERAFLQKNKEELKKDIENLEKDRILALKVDAVFLELIDRLNDQSIKMVENLVSEGLCSILEKQYEFVVKCYNKRSNLCYKFLLMEEGQEVDIMKSHGGGLAAIVSILLRIVAILVSNPPMKRVLLLDESLAQLSKQHIYKAGLFLKKLGRQLGFTIIMVTHDEGFIDHADKVYRITKGGKYANVKEITNVENV